MTLSRILRRRPRKRAVEVKPRGRARTATIIGLVIAGLISTPGVANADQFRNGQWIYGSIEREFIRFLNPNNSSRIGEPNSPELLAGADGRGRWQAFGFDTNRILWSPDVDQNRGRQIGGLILNKWLTYGDRPAATTQPIVPSYERGRLGYPTTAEEQAVGGRYNNFQGGAITYQNGTLSAFATWGDIRNSWAQSGYETGQYGFPSSNEMRCAQQPTSNGTFGAFGQLYSNGTRYINAGVATSFGGNPNNRYDHAVDTNTMQLPITGTTKYQGNLDTAVSNWNSVSNGQIAINTGAPAGASALQVRDVNIPGGYVGQFDPFGRTLSFNDAYMNTAPVPGGVDYRTTSRRNHTVAHELGHALGLRHSCETQLMTPVNSEVPGPRPLDRIVYNEIWAGY